jgi:hypothetical protein
MSLYDDVPDDDLNLHQIDELLGSTDAKDVERGKRLSKAAISSLTGLLRSGLAFDPAKTLFGQAAQIAEDYQRSQKRQAEILGDLARHRAAREQRRAQAEVADIRAAEVLDEMLDVTRLQGVSLDKMTMFMQTLTALTHATSVQEEGRWKRSWPLQRRAFWVGVFAAIAATAAAIGSFIVFARGPSPVIVRVPTTSTTVHVQNPRGRSADNTGRLEAPRPPSLQVSTALTSG